MDSVMAHDITAYFIDRTVSFTKQCLGITFITSRLVGKVFGWSASPFSPLSCTPSISIVAGGAFSTATDGGMATAIFNVRGRSVPFALALPTALRGAETREIDVCVVKALAVPHEHRAMAEAVAAAVAFMVLR